MADAGEVAQVLEWGVAAKLSPEWAPNVHPLVVHFPIALLTMAVVLDLIAVAWPRRPALPRVAALLYVVGACSLGAAYLTGRAASQTVWLPGMAHATVAHHAAWALRALVSFSALAVLRLVLLGMAPARRSRAVAAGLALAGLLALGVLVRTGDYGGRLVYQHGVGTAHH